MQIYVIYVYQNLCSPVKTQRMQTALIACYKIKQYGIQRFGLRFHNRKADTKLFLLMSLIFCSKNTPCIIETKDKIADRDEARLHISITRSLLEAILNTINCQKFWPDLSCDCFHLGRRAGIHSHVQNFKFQAGSVGWLI